MIDGVEIIISCGFISETNSFIDFHKKVCYLNDKIYNVDSNFLNKLKKILYTFKNEYGNKDGVDNEEFTITVYTNETQSRYHGKGYFPVHYEELKKLLGDLNGK